MTVPSSQQEADAEYPVQLYVYDLSRGMARQMSMPLMGRQVDGIWHTSIVAWNREYFFGQGISIVHPGTSHHGAPLETHSLGSTSIDLDTFEGALLPDIQQRFRPQDYNLLSWNCNNFTQEVSNILTGNDIPPHIRSLPSDFLSTPFGRMLRPQTDSMFRGPDAAPLARGNDDLLSQVANRAYSGNTSIESSSPSTADDVRHITSLQELEELQSVYPCVAALFTSDSCPPCSIIKPHFRDLARLHHYDESASGNHKRIAFAQIDQNVSASQLFYHYGISAVPTVKCFTLGKESQQVQGADTRDLSSAIDLMLSEVYPTHPHNPLMLKSRSRVPGHPHTFSMHPNYRNAIQKLDSLATQYPAKTFADKADLQDARRVLANVLIPWLEATTQAASTKSCPSTTAAELNKAVNIFKRLLPVTALFPVVDMLRIAVLNASFLQQSVAHGSKDANCVLTNMLTYVAMLAKDGQWETSRKAIYVTTGRLLSNAISTDTFMDLMESDGSLCNLALELVAALLLCPDAGVRGAAATCVFNVALHQHKQRAEWINKDPQAPPMLGNRLGEGWDSEVASALLQAVTNETESDETLHRLLAALLYHIHFSQSWQDSIGPLLEVLEAQDVLQSKAKHAVVLQSVKKADLTLLLDDLICLVAVR